ncbi:MAG: HEPN domain-containing protein [Dehalococcoidia bacterium]
MRAETELWWRQAQADLVTAEVTLREQRFYAAAWFIQQAVEKGLKALYVEQRGTLTPRTHNLVQLGRDISAPTNLDADLASLNPAFGASRYPDLQKGTIPVDEVTETRAVGYLESGRRIMTWLDRALNRTSNPP